MQKTAYEMRISDWSSDVCSSDLDWVQKVMARMGLKEDDIIESPLVSKQIANAQRKVEAHNFDIRKNLLDFDDVNNDQRKVIYQQRNELLEADSIKDSIDRKSVV